MTAPTTVPRSNTFAAARRKRPLVPRLDPVFVVYVDPHDRTTTGSSHPQSKSNSTLRMTGKILVVWTVTWWTLWWVWNSPRQLVSMPLPEDSMMLPHVRVVDGNDAIQLAHSIPAKRLVQQFQFLYGGGDQWATRGLWHMSLDSTIIPKLASRLRTGAATGAAASAQQHHVVFVGSSAAAGVGLKDRFDAYSFVFQRLITQLQPPSLWTVTHLTMEDSAEFPLLWCLNAFVSSPSTITMVVWDYGPSTPVKRLEAFVRVLITQYDNPILVVRDVSTEQRDMLTYYENHAHLCLVVINDRPAARSWTRLKPRIRPEGFRQWTTTTKTSSSSSSSTENRQLLLSKAHHQWIGWLLVMSMVAALEYHPQQQPEPPAQQPRLPGVNQDAATMMATTTTVLPSPLTLLPEPFAWNNLVQGEYDTNHLHCYTTFDFAPRKTAPGSQVLLASSAAVPDATYGLDHHHDLEMLVLDGKGTAQELLLPKVDLYTRHSSWVLDLDDSSKRSKMLSRNTNFSNFFDWKKAYYGVSGTLTIFLPIRHAVSGQKVSDVVEQVLLCESDAPMGVCQLGHGGVAVTMQGQRARLEPIQSDSIAVFEKYPCVQVVLPHDAVVSEAPAQVLPTIGVGTFGLTLQVKVTNPQVTIKNGPCSIAHVIYETISDSNN